MSRLACGFPIRNVRKGQGRKSGDGGIAGAWHARLDQDGPAVKFVVERAGTYGAEGWGWVRGDWVVRWGWEGMTLE